MSELFTRRSIRSYNSTPVEEEKLLSVLNAGEYAPSAMNNMDRQFTAILNPAVLELLNDTVKAAVDPESVKRIESRMGGKFSFFYDAPVLIVVSHYRDGLAPAADCAVALENMFIRAKELGLGTCWINQLNTLCGDKRVRRVLTMAGVNPDHDVFGCCALGYSDTEGEIFKEKRNKIVICK